MTVAQRTTANSLISGKGQAISIAGTTSATYDPSTGSTTETAYSKSGYGALLPLDKAKKIDGTLIKQGDETLLISALDSTGAALPEPPVNAVVTLADGTTKLTIVAIERLSPAGLDIMFDAVVRMSA